MNEQTFHLFKRVYDAICEQFGKESPELSFVMCSLPYWFVFNFHDLMRKSEDTSSGKSND
ncbi:hypothetical protein [Dipodfec virus UA06Rod_19]|uniref:Uncharacterized protein n=1 Tax=Dipodfec virus UA06Rod_19 TaxID=2929319 RepID=A0A976N1K8_9VIRU|nr:hypothetical protein [Dipodfec virus UA06Rod_19]